jgi:glycine/serine hydroxymethyltransferase
VTTRGLGVDEMDLIAGWIDAALGADEAGLDRIAAEVRELALAFPPPV